MWSGQQIHDESERYTHPARRCLLEFSSTAANFHAWELVVYAYQYIPRPVYSTTTQYISSSYHDEWPLNPFEVQWADSRCERRLAESQSRGDGAGLSRLEWKVDRNTPVRSFHSSRRRASHPQPLTFPPSVAQFLLDIILKPLLRHVSAYSRQNAGNRSRLYCPCAVHGR
jgi:hypothetical protein